MHFAHIHSCPVLVCLDALCHMYCFSYMQMLNQLSVPAVSFCGVWGESLWMPLFLVLGAPCHVFHFLYEKMLNQLTVPAVSFFKGVWGGFVCVDTPFLVLGSPCHTLPLFLMCKCWISWQFPSFLSSGEAFAAPTPTSSVARVNIGTEDI